MKIFLSVFAVLVILKIADSSTPTITNREIVNEGLKFSIQILNSTIDYLEELNQSYAANSTLLKETRQQELLERTNVIFDQVFNVINKILKHLESSWSEPGKIIIDCIRNEENNARLHLNETYTKYGVCINAQLPKVIDSYQSLLEASITTRDKLSVAQIRLESCRLGDLCLVLRTIPDLRGIEVHIKDVIQSLPSFVDVLFEVFLMDRPACFEGDEGNVSKLFSKILECALS